MVLEISCDLKLTLSETNGLDINLIDIILRSIIVIDIVLLLLILILCEVLMTYSDCVIGILYCCWWWLIHWWPFFHSLHWTTFHSEVEVIYTIVSDHGDLEITVTCWPTFILSVMDLRVYYHWYLPVCALMMEAYIVLMHFGILLMVFDAFCWCSLNAISLWNSIPATDSNAEAIRYRGDWSEGLSFSVTFLTWWLFILTLWRVLICILPEADDRAVHCLVGLLHSSVLCGL